MTVKFPKTLAAAQVAEASQWKVGDALMREAEESFESLAQVVEELAAHGIEWTVRHLYNLRRTAEVFPKSRRR